MPESFGAKRCEIDGYKFDSLSEGRRFQELKLLRYARQIEELEVHPKLIIIPAYEDNKTVWFTADFSYYDCKEKLLIVEDVKPWKRNAKGERVPYLTREFILKWKLVQYNYRAREFRIVES